MARYANAKELKAEILAAFPPGKGELFYQLYNDVSSLHFHWKNYRSLFGTSPERIDLLNWSAPTFFAFLDDILRDDIILRIARLTDPAQTAGRDNLSLARLIDELSSYVEPDFVEELEFKLEALRTYCEPIRQLGTRTLVHEDLAAALTYHPEPLPGVSGAFIEGAVGQISHLMNDIEGKFRDSPTAYGGIDAAGNAESLIFALERAREYEEYRRRELKHRAGQPGR